MAIASYVSSVVPEYRGNPLIEALPPIIRDDREVMEAMSIRPQISGDERDLDASIRRELISRLNDLFIPLPPHFQLLERLSTSVRRSYTWRNPLRPQTQAYLHQKVVSLSPETLAARSSAGSVLFIKGISGIGKSTGTEACLRGLGPCVIQHSAYAETLLSETQIVWLKVSCPEDRKLKSLCISVLAAAEGALGGEARYTVDLVDDPRATTGKTVGAVMKCLANHHVGILVIDEVQNLFSAKGQVAVELLNFLLRLRDESGICFVVCGTYASLNLLQNTFRIGRRIAAGGVIEFKRPASPSDPEWRSFSEILWMYQWVKRPSEFADSLALQLFDLTQGIRGLAVPLMIRAQEDAIADGSESVTAESLVRTWRKHFSQLDRAMGALRSNDAKALAEWDDLCDASALRSPAAYPQFHGSSRQDDLKSRNGDEASAGASKKERKKRSAGARESGLQSLLSEGGLATLAAEGTVGISGLGIDT